MEEDVRPSPPERLGDGESLVESDTTQQPQTTESHVLPKKAPGTPAPRDTPGTPFSRLPRTVIEQILHVADASTFASLAFLNRKWRRISNSPLLYGHHLCQCPSFALSQKAADADRTQTGDLAILKRQFFSEIRRNGFDVFFRPHQILVKLISTSMSSSTAFPRGEAFRFAFSQNGQLILCISSSRIVVLDVAADPPAVKYELKTLRRPLHATILDDGSLLAVVSSSHQVNIYTLSNAEAKLIQNLKLNDVPRTLALSPAGSVLAIAYNDMIEVYAVGEGALATERRAVRCAGVDSLSFSSDGVILLGSSDNPSTGSLVTITVPLYGEQEPEISVKDVQVQMWTTQILFPEVVHNYSYACLLPSHTEGEGSWILGYDNKLGTFRATGLNKSSSGTIYFASPMSEDTIKEHPPMMLASADCEGELVALGFHDSGVWVYGLPDRLDIAPVTPNASEAQARPRTAQSQSTVGTDTGTNISRLQQTITRPKVLINGHRVTDIAGITAAHWVRRNYSTGQPRRLAAVAPGGVDNASFGDEDVPLDGGRILLLDFACSATNGESTELIIEIGEAEPVLLREPNSSLDTEVELERRRTRVHRGSTGRGNRESYPAASSNNRPRPRRNSSYLSASSSEVADGEIPPILDSPYDNTQPRSQDTLRRAATAAAANRRRVAEETRRAIQDSTVPAVFQIPHESDADNWVPPPPPYSREADAPLPDYLRRSLLPPTRRYGQNAAESFRRSLSTRFSSESSSRPSLHRLNTITGSSLASRVRGNAGETSTSGHHRRHTSLVRGRAGSSSQTQPLSSVNESTVPAHPQGFQMVPIAVPAAPNGTMLVNPIAPTIQAQAQPAPIQVPSHTQFSYSQLVMPAVPPTPPAMNNYLYSLSSPNLIPEHLIPESPETPTSVQHTSARQHDRTQSYDYQPPLSAAALRNRRASTDPTHSSAQSVAPEQQWRRRIEEWNERTIYERSKKRSKCAVM
ncbi:hypothetical protein BDW74DRAFT_134239 [Aspergillus multicolor]|uniref:F-box domain protein n=1 Tax=Aspergillus multicolor TaxID=41759 RepID=UPI003CCC9660